MTYKYLNVKYHDADHADLDPRTVRSRITSALQFKPTFGFWGI